jgi:hypothetical protein
MGPPAFDLDNKGIDCNLFEDIMIIMISKNYTIIVIEKFKVAIDYILDEVPQLDHIEDE